MPKIHIIPQGEIEWLRLRIGRVTASELDRLVTPDFKARTGEMPHSYLCEKLSESWRNRDPARPFMPTPGFSTWDTEEGQIREAEARAWYCLEYTDHKVTNVGFVETDNGRAGCSPDALLGTDGGLEIKCPQPTNHVRYVLAGTLPKEYAAQVHMSLYVTGCKFWRFVSYRRSFPAFVLNVDRDEEIMEKIGSALDIFYNAFDSAMKKLESMQ